MAIPPENAIVPFSGAATLPTVFDERDLGILQELYEFLDSRKTGIRRMQRGRDRLRPDEHGPEPLDVSAMWDREVGPRAAGATKLELRRLDQQGTPPTRSLLEDLAALAHLEDMDRQDTRLAGPSIERFDLGGERPVHVTQAWDRRTGRPEMVETDRVSWQRALDRMLGWGQLAPGLHDVHAQGPPETPDSPPPTAPRYGPLGTIGPTHPGMLSSFRLHKGAPAMLALPEGTDSRRFLRILHQLGVRDPRLTVVPRDPGELDVTTRYDVPNRSSWRKPLFMGAEPARTWAVGPEHAELLNAQWVRRMDRVRDEILKGALARAGRNSNDRFQDSLYAGGVAELGPEALRNSEAFQEAVLSRGQRRQLGDIDEARIGYETGPYVAKPEAPLIVRSITGHEGLTATERQAAGSSPSMAWTDPRDAERESQEQRLNFGKAPGDLDDRSRGRDSVLSHRRRRYSELLSKIWDLSKMEVPKQPGSKYTMPAWAKFRGEKFRRGLKSPWAIVTQSELDEAMREAQGRYQRLLQMVGRRPDPYERGRMSEVGDVARTLESRGAAGNVKVLRDWDGSIRETKKSVGWRPPEPGGHLRNDVEAIAGQHLRSGEPLDLDGVRKLSAGESQGAPNLSVDDDGKVVRDPKAAAPERPGITKVRLLMERLQNEVAGKPTRLDRNGNPTDVRGKPAGSRPEARPLTGKAALRVISRMMPRKFRSEFRFEPRSRKWIWTPSE